MASVALGVVGDVDDEAADGGGEFLATDVAREFEIGGCEISDAGGGVVEKFVEFVEDGVNGGGWFRFGFQRGKLGFSEVIAFGVGKETVDTAGDVADMKGDRGKAMRLSVEIVLGEAEAPVVDIFRSEFEGIEYGEVDGRQIFLATAEPGFGVGSVGHSAVYRGYCTGGLALRY